MLKIRPVLTGLLEDKVNISFVSGDSRGPPKTITWAQCQRGGTSRAAALEHESSRGGFPGQPGLQGSSDRRGLTPNSLTTSADQTTSTPTSALATGQQNLRGERPFTTRREVGGGGALGLRSPWPHREFSEGDARVQPGAPLGPGKAVTWRRLLPPGLMGPCVPRAQRRKVGQTLCGSMSLLPGALICSVHTDLFPPHWGECPPSRLCV